jgi:hypothetical protein
VRDFEDAPGFVGFEPGVYFFSSEAREYEDKRGSEVVIVGVADEVGEVEFVPGCGTEVACESGAGIATFLEDFTVSGFDGGLLRGELPEIAGRAV